MVSVCPHIISIILQPIPTVVLSYHIMISITLEYFHIPI